MKQYRIAFGLVLILAVMGFLIPPQLMKLQDDKKNREFLLEENENILLVPQASMSITEKLDLYQKDTASMMWLESGKNYDEERIVQKAAEEIEKLNSAGILDIEPETDSVIEAEAAIVVDTENSSHSINIWNVRVVWEKENEMLWLLMDDESGKILSLQYLFIAANTAQTDTVVEIKAEASDMELAEIAKKWGEYLDLELTEFYETVTENEKHYENELICIYEDEVEMTCFVIRASQEELRLSIDFLK